MASITKTTYPAVKHVLENIREDDRREIDAMLADGFDHDALLEGLFQPEEPHNYVVHADDGEPIAAFGVRIIPGEPVMAWAIGTDRWSEAVLAMTKEIKRFIIPNLMLMGVPMVHAISLSERTESNRWIEFLGGKEEAVYSGVGNQNHDLTLWSWKSDASDTSDSVH